MHPHSMRLCGMLHESHLDRSGRLSVAFICLEESPRQYQWSLASKPRRTPIPFAAKERLAINHSRTRREEPLEVVPLAIERVADELFHRAKVGRPVDVAIGVGLAVMPYVIACVFEIGFAIEIEHTLDAWDLDDAIGLLAESELGRKRRDATARGIAIVAREDVEHPGPSERVTVNVDQRVTAFPNQVSHGAGFVERPAQVRFAPNLELVIRIARSVGGLELDVHQRRENPLHVSEVMQTAQDSMPRREVRTAGIFRYRRKPNRPILSQGLKYDRFTQARSNNSIGRIPFGHGAN